MEIKDIGFCRDGIYFKGKKWTHIVSRDNITNQLIVIILDRKVEKISNMQNIGDFIGKDMDFEISTGKCMYYHNTENYISIEYEPQRLVCNITAENSNYVEYFEYKEKTKMDIWKEKYPGEHKTIEVYGINGKNQEFLKFEYIFHDELFWIPNGSHSQIGIRYDNLDVIYPAKNMRLRLSIAKNSFNEFEDYLERNGLKWDVCLL